MAKKVKLVDGTEFTCFDILNRSYYYQGIQRNSLTFYFDTSTTVLSKLIEKFTDNNCSSIIISDDEDESSFVYNYYQIIDQIGTGTYSSVSEGPVSSDSDKKCLFVKVLQTSYSERLLSQHDEAIDDIIIALLEGK